MIRRVVLAAVAVLAVLTVIGIVAQSAEDDKAEAAGCTAVERTQPTPPGGKHRSGPIDYAEAPPNAGEHSPNTLRILSRFYARDDAPDPERAVHDLEHGVIVAWYDDELPAADVAALKEVADDIAGRFVAVPWRRSVFPGGRHLALTAWGTTQRCRTVSAGLVKDFYKDHVDSEDAPERTYSV